MCHSTLEPNILFRKRAKCSKTYIPRESLMFHSSRPTTGSFMLVHFKLKALLVQYYRQNLTHKWETEASPIYRNGFCCFEEMETLSFRLGTGMSRDFIIFVFQLSIFSAMHDLQLYPSNCTYCTGLPTRGDLCDLPVETESFFSLLCYSDT
jgi:hypothetical protein